MTPEIVCALFSITKEAPLGSMGMNVERWTFIFLERLAQTVALIRSYGW
jgi:hypothetical protein